MRSAKEWHYYFKGKEITADGIGAIQCDVQDDTAAELDKLLEINAELVEACKLCHDLLTSPTSPQSRPAVWGNCIHLLDGVLPKAKQEDG